MGVFGVQIVVTMVMTSVLSKVIPHMSLGNWLLCNTGLSYFLHPTDEQLKDKKKSSQKNNKTTSDSQENGTFPVMLKNIDINLEKKSITQVEVSFCDCAYICVVKLAY